MELRVAIFLPSSFVLQRVSFSWLIDKTNGQICKILSSPCNYQFKQITWFVSSHLTLCTSFTLTNEVQIFFYRIRGF